MFLLGRVLLGDADQFVDVKVPVRAI
jgi:hypothetical protein